MKLWAITLFLGARIVGDVFTAGNETGRVKLGKGGGANVPFGEGVEIMVRR